MVSGKAYFADSLFFFYNFRLILFACHQHWIRFCYSFHGQVHHETDLLEVSILWQQHLFFFFNFPMRLLLVFGLGFTTVMFFMANSIMKLITWKVQFLGRNICFFRFSHETFACLKGWDSSLLWFFVAIFVMKLITWKFHSQAKLQLFSAFLWRSLLVPRIGILQCYNFRG